MTNGHEGAAKKSKGATHRVHHRRVRSSGSQSCDALSREGRDAVRN